MALLDLFRGSKTGEKIVAEVQATTFEARKNLVTERERIRSDYDAAQGKLAKAVDDAAAALKTAEAAFKAAQTVRNSTQAAWMQASMGRDLAVAKIDRTLEAGADPRIAEFIARLEIELGGSRSRADSAIPLHSVNRPAQPREISSYERICRHIEGLRQAMGEANALRSQAQTEPELMAAFAEIESRIPSRFAVAA